MADAKTRVAVMISGRGSNLEALIAAAAHTDYPANIVLVLSNRADAKGLVHARDHGIPTAIVDQTKGETKTEMEKRFDAALRDAGVELICLAGFMRLLTAGFVAAWHDRILNIHPSLLPLFPGLDTHARALAAGVKVHGATVHFVRAKMDAGPIIAQGAVPVLAGDNAEALQQRVLRMEHRLYPLALALVAGGKARGKGDRVVIDDEAAAAGAALLSPPD